MPVFPPLFLCRVEAGFPSPADDWIEASLDLNRYLVKRPMATFYIRVKGESMRGAGIQDGDLLIVDRSIAPRDNHIVIAVLDGELTVKRLSKRGDAVRLLPENPAFAPIEIANERELHIWGVVTACIHKV